MRCMTGEKDKDVAYLVCFSIHFACYPSALYDLPVCLVYKQCPLKKNRLSDFNLLFHMLVKISYAINKCLY